MSAANSVACLRMTPASPPPQRESIRTLLPSVHPNCASACTKAAKRPCAAATFPTPVSAPTSRTRSCARAANGIAAAPIPAMNSRRLMTAPPFVGSVARSIRVCFGPRGGAFTPPPSHAHCNRRSGLASCWRRWRRTKAQRGVAATSTARCGRKKLPHLPNFPTSA